ncbi:MAG TPA: hypothetical protein VF337_06270 [Candidatus Limnocylindrales bacterium]
MRIEQSQVWLSSQRTASVTDFSRTSVEAWVGDRPTTPKPAVNSTTISPAAVKAAIAKLSAEARTAARTAAATAAGRELVSSGAAASQTSSAGITDSTDPTTTDPNLNLLMMLIERMTGRKIHLFNPNDFRDANSAARQAGQNATAAVAAADGAAQPAAQPQQAGWGLEIKVDQVHQETETAGFQATGQLTTADGRTISFAYSLAMHRDFSQSSSVDITAGDAVKKVDPIALNLTSGPVALSSDRTAFDINSDGTDEQVALPAAGTYFLALDANGNGKIDNGSELFGPSSGNGFSELKALDSDQNGWIDEGDAAYATLKLWSGPSGGVTSLSDAGVGALFVGQAASTQFDIRSNTNESLGQVVSSSVYLGENGKAGALQQVDLTA